ncbi:uncharacterized protein LOC133483105 isoform X2 [Phyllopteryx taeniolatus]|uniref:uncharacterized protein LOC133483105 isoform X2 n=1 Tax=Phyllopteryx taeniolatus TaxID=161469 RepID=UPI002AD32B37|nr:uncharacterized protein LOC133483105 isoform X2 [Phyllopteryx taeniolatus]
MPPLRLSLILASLQPLGAPRSERGGHTKSHVCARGKTSHLPPAGLLRPLPIPSRPWSHIALDFITGLPPSEVISTTLATHLSSISLHYHLHKSLPDPGNPRQSINVLPCAPSVFPAVLTSSTTLPSHPPAHATACHSFPVSTTRQYASKIPLHILFNKPFTTNLSEPPLASGSS